jgi:hypothetical protein
MKSIVLSLLFILTVQTLFPQEKGGFGGVAVESQDQFPVYPGKTAKSLSKSLDNYEVELFPGQKFDGWYYFWSTEGTLTCNYKENPEVNWVSITPKKFTSTGCSDITPVKFSFLAPEEKGDYEVIFIDSLSNWSNLTIRLRVTSAPVSAVIRSYGINKDSISYKHFIKRYPINFSTNNCIKDYLNADTATFSFSYKPAKTWLNITPLSGKLFRDNIFDLRSRIIKRQFDSTWVVYNREFASYPILYHYYAKQTEPKNYLLHFNGENIITTDYYPNNSTKTLMYWLRADKISTQGVGTNDLQNHRFYLGIQSNNALFAGMGNSYTPLTYINLIPGEWYHLTMTTTQDMDSAVVYINANEVSRFAYSFSGESKADLYIGARNDSASTARYPLIGYIDEVQLWERPLNRNEILKYMFSPPGGIESGLVIYYSFDEGWGNFTMNTVDNYYSGTLFFEPQWIDNISRPYEAPPKPSLLTPANNSEGIAIDTTLIWKYSSGATSYHLQVSLSSDFTTPIINKPGLIITSFPLTNLGYKTRYYWRVSASNPIGTSSWSDTWNYKTTNIPPAKPTLLTPSNGAKDITRNPVLEWEIAARAESYCLQVSLNSDFTMKILDMDNLTSTKFSLSSLMSGITYYWRVRADNDSGQSEFSDTWDLSIKPPSVTTGATQQVISSAGVSTGGTSSQLAWTIGEPVTETFTAAKSQNILTQGFHQSKLVITIVDPPVYPGIILTVYPNPVDSDLRLETRDEIMDNLSLRLYDMNGKLLLDQKIESQSELIDIQHYPNGSYFLKVLHNNKDLLQTFKIIKN